MTKDQKIKDLQLKNARLARRIGELGLDYSAREVSYNGRIQDQKQIIAEKEETISKLFAAAQATENRARGAEAEARDARSALYHLCAGLARR